MKLKKLLASLAVSAVFASNAYAATELTVWCWDDKFNIPAAKLAGEYFNKTHKDVTVKVESVANDNVIQKLNAALGANNVSSLPDIVLLEDYRVQNFVKGYPGFLKDLSKVIDYDNFVAYKSEVSKDNDKIYGVPFDSGVSVLFVRLDLFEKAGYSEADLQDLTWDKYIEMGKKVYEVTKVPLMPYDPNDLMELRIMMQSGKRWYTTADGNSVDIANNPVLKEGLLIHKKLNDNGILFPYSGWNQFLAAFQGGKVASVVSACWLTPSIEAAADLKGKWRVVKIPRLDNIEGASNVSNQGGSQWYVNSYSKNADLAAQFLKETFGSNKELLNQLAKDIGLISTMKGASEFPNYQNKNDYFGGQQVSKLYSEWNEQIPGVNYGQHTKAVESIIQEALQRVLAGEEIDTVLEQTQEIATAQLGL